MGAIQCQVRERLLATRGTVRLPTSLLDLFVLRNFLAPEECERLIAMIDAGRRPSRLLAQHPDPQFRTSETCLLDQRDGLIRAVELRLSALLGLNLDLGEFLQGQRYGPGQRFKAHHDFLRTDQPYWEQQDRNGGQRTWTAMIFLNVPEAGGATHFPIAEATIPPRRGSLVTWNNLDSGGRPNPATLHQGLPVRSGAKYIVTKWYRERPWAPSLRMRTPGTRARDEEGS